jgi:hypothetical protein
MKINNKAKYIIVIGILLFSTFFLLYILFNVSHLNIVDIKDNAVAYSDGTAEIVINDNFNGDYVVYSAKVNAVSDGQYFAPDLTYRGGTGDRIVYTYSQSDYCENNIFYMDRNKKVAKILNTNYCIEKTLDEHDIKYFFGTKSNESEVMIGFYNSGKVFSKIIIPYALGRPIDGASVASNWELTKLIVPVGNCDKGSKDMKIFLWDVENKTIEDKTPLNFDCSIKGISYEHSEDIFYIDRFNNMNEIISTRLE